MDTSLLSDVVIYSVQIACVVAIGGALAALVHIDAADVRYFYWRVLLALCLALPWLQVRHTVVVPVLSVPRVLTAPPSAGATMAETLAIQTAPLDWMAVAGWILVGGIVIRLAGVAIGLWRLRRLRSAGYAAPLCDVHRDVQELVRSRADVRYVPSGQPVTFGFRRPVVLLPESLRSQPVEIRRVVLCHELFHVRRRDWMWVVAEEMVKAVFWFHPPLLWLVSRVRLAREEVVDELTVLATAERRAYMEALLVFADTPARTPAAAFARKRHLFRRMLLISKEAVMSSKRVVFSSAAMAVVLVVGGWFAVSTFPLTEVLSAQGRGRNPAPAAASNEPGPLERQAKPITPENPIPRRTFSVTPQNPSDDTTGMVFVSVRVVVDRQGRVAEARNAGGGVIGGRRGAPSSVAPPRDTFMKAAIDAVRQWQYDPPADGPIAFDVSFSFAQGSEPQMVSHGGPAAIRFSSSPNGVIGGVVGGVVGGRAEAAPPPPPPPPPPDWALGAVRVGGNVHAPTKVKHVNPEYPPIAQSARVQGVVILEAIIGTDGHVDDARVLRSIPLLDQAALDAVRQWEFTPTHLNGAPVPVIMTVTVQFTLQ
jgi:TonB family protein